MSSKPEVPRGARGSAVDAERASDLLEMHLIVSAVGWGRHLNWVDHSLGGDRGTVHGLVTVVNSIILVRRCGLAAVRIWRGIDPRHHDDAFEWGGIPAAQGCVACVEYCWRLMDGAVSVTDATPIVPGVASEPASWSSGATVFME
jgi:hypothetical protein